MKAVITRWAACAAMSCLLASEVVAQVHEVTSETKWLFNGGTLVPISAKARPGGTYVLGVSTATVGAVSQSTPEKTAPYAFPMATDTNPVQVGGSPTALAGARMDTTGVDAQGWFSYTLLLGAATLGVGPFTDNASAIARGGDPQEIETAGVFSAGLGLGAGSRLYASTAGDDDAYAHFELGAYGLDGPLASLDLSMEDEVGKSSVEDIHFASDPRLHFYYPGTTTELSDPESYVRSLLEGATGLNSADGLNSDLMLFDYSYDLANTPIPAGAAFTSSGANTVTSRGGIPEPGSLVLVLSAGASLAGITIKRRR
jgi:hypothetical protein